MFIDLILITIVGSLVEAVAIVGVSKLIPKAVPMFVIGVFMVILAITRWRQWGLLIIPFLSLSSTLSGFFILGLQDIYNFKWFVCCCIGFLGPSIELLYVKKFSINKTFDGITSFIGLVVLCLICTILLETLSYCIINNDYRFLEVLQQMSLHSIFGSIVTIIGVSIMSTQNMMIDVKTTFVAKKKEIEAEKALYDNHLIKEVSDCDSEKENSQKKDN